MSAHYQLLIKHFTGGTSLVEEKQIEIFKKSHPKEYQRIESLWFSEMSNTKDMDLQKAWTKIKSEALNYRTDKKSFVLKRQHILMISCLLLVGLFLFLQIRNQLGRTVIENKDPAPKELILPDMSKVVLNSGAVISYSKSFNKEERNILLKGEAFFEVQRDEDRPFEITTTEALITVLGTSFNIKNMDQTTEVNVVSGKVQVETLLQDTSIVLIKGEASITSKFSLIKSESQNINFESWRTGIVYLDDMSLSEAVVLLNEYYNDNLVLVNNQTNCNISTTLKKLKIEQVAEIIATTCNLKTRLKDGKQEIY